MQSGVPCPPVAHQWPVSGPSVTAGGFCKNGGCGPSSQVVRSLRILIFRHLCICSPQWFRFPTFYDFHFHFLIIFCFGVSRFYARASFVYFRKNVVFIFLSAIRNSSLYRNSSLESVPFIICFESLVGFLNTHERMKPLHVFSIKIYVFCIHIF